MLSKGYQIGQYVLLNQVGSADSAMSGKRKNAQLWTRIILR